MFIACLVDLEWDFMRCFWPLRLASLGFYVGALILPRWFNSFFQDSRSDAGLYEKREGKLTDCFRAVPIQCCTYRPVFISVGFLVYAATQPVNKVAKCKQPVPVSKVHMFSAAIVSRAQAMSPRPCNTQSVMLQQSQKASCQHDQQETS